ncbi:putative PIF1 DNA helicase/replication protein A1-like protein [Tanacetum coccineum]
MTLHRGGRLFQQYLVDAFTAIEEQRLSWMRNNQDTLRVDLYHNVVDAITRCDTHAASLGKRIVLPISFISGPRAHVRPKVWTRVFKLKLTELLDDLTKNHVFGATRVVMYDIEFQKRGLPHVHILLWLKEYYRCKAATDIDDIISAKLPSPTADPAGYKAVSDYMLHGPCGKDNRVASCNVEGKCSKHFPKPFYAETVIDQDGYPIYKRRDDKVCLKKGNFTFDNKHVVPHNRYLLLKYQAHIKVEWFNRSKAIKYLFKYLNKGPDRATIVIQENVQKGQGLTKQKIMVVDEIKNYLNGCYLAPCEAVWRIFSFDIHHSYPSVMKLNFYLPNKQPVTLHDTEWECYFLRMLLNVVRTTLKFEQLLIVNGRIYDTFKEACFAYGLLNDDKEWTRGIQEASLWALGPQLRDLFVTILLFCDVRQPLKLWEENWEVLSDDILHKKRLLFKYPELQLTTKQIQNYCLMEIQDLLNTNGRTLTEFSDMPQPNPALLTSVDNRLIREARAFDMNNSKIQHQQLYPQLNLEQHLIYEEVVDSVPNKKGQFHFVYGPGGTRKTFLYKTIISRLRSELKIVLVVASSGIALLLLPGGRTAHSRFVIPLELLENSTCGIKQNTHLAELMQQVELIIWDEAPMMQKYAFEALDKTLREILGYPDLDKQNKIFGGMTVLLGGNFKQILLVIPKGKREDIVQECINRSELWKHCKIVEKTYPNFIQRQQDDAHLRERAILTPRNDNADAINAYMVDKLAGQAITYHSSDEI